MFYDDGVRSHNQIQGVDEQGNLRNVKVNENGEIVTAGSGGAGVVSASAGKTILCDVIQVGTDASVSVGKKVSRLEVGNYSVSAKVSIMVIDKIFKIGPNMVIEIVVNAVVDSFSLSATESCEVQVLVEGED